MKILAVTLNITFTLNDPINLIFELNCTSVGRPVSEMVWKMNGLDLMNSNRYPVLSNSTSATYHSTLVVFGRNVGNYSCQVTDEHGTIIAKKNYSVSG